MVHKSNQLCCAILVCNKTSFKCSFSSIHNYWGRLITKVQY